MKKYLFLFLILILFIPNVLAEEEFTGQIFREFEDGMSIPVAETSCSTNIAPNIFYYSKHTFGTLTYNSFTKSEWYVSYLIPVLPGSVYTIKVPRLLLDTSYEKHGICPYTSNFSKGGSYCQLSNTKLETFDYTVPSNVSYLVYYLSYPYSKTTFIPNRDFGIFLKSDYDDTGYVPYRTCTSEPTVPDTPDIPQYSGDQVQLLSNFYSIYFDKIKLLATYAEENFLFLSFIGILLLFIILEIFLNLFSLKRRRL